ncbi:MAG: glutathione S-transferase family protein [Pseudomonadota bacterium]
MTYVLHYAPDNASLIVRMALEHRGLAYETRLVDRRTQEQKGATYLALNPQGLIPTLETPNGPIFETAAILLWLADTHGGLGPSPEDVRRGAFLKWLFFLSNTAHAALRRLFYPDQYVEGPKDPVRKGATRALTGHFASLERIAGQPDVPLGLPNPTVLDFYVCAMLRWSAIYPQSYDRSWFALAQYPALAEICERVEALPCTSCLHVTEGLGTQPFTHPHPPQPPEGSAT